MFSSVGTKGCGHSQEDHVLCQHEAQAAQTGQGMKQEAWILKNKKPPVQHPPLSSNQKLKYSPILEILYRTRK